MFFWTQDSIRWYKDASVWTGYHKKLAAELEEFLSPDVTVCDIGCGTGLLSMELAGKVWKILAVDKDSAAIDFVRLETGKRNLKYMVALEADYHDLPDGCCDVAMACSFGSLKKDLYDFIKIPTKRFIMINRNKGRSKDGFEGGCRASDSAQSDEGWLIANKIPYYKKTFTVDFGQPLRNEEEAQKFMEHYRLTPQEGTLKELLERSRLKEPGEFQYYIPNEKEMVIIVIDKA